MVVLVYCFPSWLSGCNNFRDGNKKNKFLFFFLPRCITVFFAVAVHTNYWNFHRAKINSGLSHSKFFSTKYNYKMTTVYYVYVYVFVCVRANLSSMYRLCAMLFSKWKHDGYWPCTSAMLKNMQKHSRSVCLYAIECDIYYYKSPQ